ncbi:hypothetical protein ACWT_6488 [Actinoplanes sp. SE50]|uniref:hypothetical protein n=1 Tax=unclassified Actinoplanes TaxID=2626549 RepID=UPI00023EC17E|nr:MULTISPECIES: hypothetical protein [unclassified Actinoplanes]AEV87500.1 hypothetical protein ACPL_6618 [Actinoplanes sp. SE50/110]ATO85903.1 hypothetical protein ACWT_6488 [Actinoplanes sp. SE50]SLM03317.1 hypothetical protein ACSP50_6606 [Actinoplanes sp. SE50/110]
MTDYYAKGPVIAPRRRRAQLNWLLTVLPAFPLMLLVLRVWYLSRQDLPTMLLMVQYINPLGMISALFITLSWAIPAVILILRVLGGILLVSNPGDAGRSPIAVAALRMPDWVVLIAVLIAGFTWQLRLLPALEMLVVAVLGLTAVQRLRVGRPVMAWNTLVVPILVGVLTWIFVWPGVVSAIRGGEQGTALMLAVPPLLGPLLTGPVPARWARLVTHWPAVAAATALPIVVGVVFLRAPVLPRSAIEVGPPDGPVREVIVGQLIAVDDTSTTMLLSTGEVTFIPNGQMRSKILCPEPVRPPESAVAVRGWPVEETVLEWIAPTRKVTEIDPRCLGRPHDPA